MAFFFASEPGDVGQRVSPAEYHLVVTPVLAAGLGI
jgi:hypothetical protein